MKLNTVMFLGTPAIAIPTLEGTVSALPNATLHIVTKPDTEQGRGRQVAPSAIKNWALTHLKTATVHTPRNKSALSELVESINPDLIVIIAYGMIVPKSITDNYLCINCHASILPQYRGPSPIHAALLNGDSKTGITLMKINEKMDEGDILYCAEIPIAPDDNLSSLSQKLGKLSGETIEYYINEHVKKETVLATPQQHEQASYTHLLHTKDREINSQDTPTSAFNKIRTYGPKPGAYITLSNGKTMKLIDATLENQTLSLITVQPEGKAAMPYHDYCLGNKDGIQLPFDNKGAQ